MDAKTGELDAKSWQPRQCCLLGGPVVPVGPVRDKLAQVVDVRAERPPGILGRIWPARRPQPRALVFDGRPRVGWSEGLRSERVGRHAAHVTVDDRRPPRLLSTPWPATLFAECISSNSTGLV